MPRYFFHLHDDLASVLDDEGLELADEEAAFDHAVWSIREIAASSILAGQPVSLASYIAIHSSEGAELRRAYFRKVIAFRDLEPDR
jgi:hypothetical protein